MDLKMLSLRMSNRKRVSFKMALAKILPEIVKRKKTSCKNSLNVITYFRNSIKNRSIFYLLWSLRGRLNQGFQTHSPLILEQSSSRNNLTIRHFKQYLSILLYDLKDKLLLKSVLSFTKLTFPPFTICMYQVSQGSWPS